MKLNRFRKRRRDHPSALLKHVYFSDQEVWYRSFSRNLGLKADSSQLLDIYPALVDEIDQYNKHLRNYFLVLGAGLLAALGIVTEINYSGVKFTQASVSLFVLVALGFTSFMVGWRMVKVRPAQAIFMHVWSKSNASDRSFLMLRFPKAFGSHLYYVSPNLNSDLVTSYGSFGKMIAFVLLSFSAAIFLFLLPIYIFLTLSIEVWTEPDADVITKFLVAGSVTAAIGRWILPTGSLYKTRYQHNGLVKLLNHAMNTDNARYMRAMKRISEVGKAEEENAT